MPTTTIRRRKSTPAPLPEEVALLARLRAGDEAAFVTLVDRHHDAMVRLASTFVASRALAEEVAQDTWLGLLRGIDRFEGRSSLRTWLLSILVNRARTTAVREARSIAIGDPTPALDRSRFDETGGWATPPEHWVEDAEERLGAAALASRLRVALDGLPARQRAVVMLRDVDGLDGDEVCTVLAISSGNMRVLLHRGRAALREAIEATMHEAGS